MKVRKTLAISGVVVALSLLTCGACIWLFQDQIALARIKPSVPFDVLPPPAKPDYSDRRAWAAWPDDAEKGGADIFLIHSTTFSTSANWNAPVTGSAATLAQKTVLPEQAAPFASVGAVYAPHYRQATLFAELSPSANARAALEFAHKDIDAAFDRFLAARANKQRPFIVAGYRQGAIHALGLLQQRIATQPALHDTLAAAYIIDAPVPDFLFDEAMGDIQLCAGPQDPKCIVSYVSLEKGLPREKHRVKESALFWNADGVLQVVKAPGIACVDVENMSAPRAGSRCADGLLLYARPTRASQQTNRWFGRQWRQKNHYPLKNAVAADAARRTAAATQQLDDASRILEPIGEAVDLVDSPVNKVRE